MPPNHDREELARRGMAVWKQYQAEHDITPLLGQVAGIDPDSGQIWFGSSALDVVEQARQVNPDVLLYLVRVGRDYYARKGGRRG